MNALRGTLARLLICNLLAPAPAVAAAPIAHSPLAFAAGAAAPLQGDQRILHALNRFTFGPRPGDVAAVRAIGLDAWFEQQLHPASIDETALNAHLTRFPAMQWNLSDLLFRMPPNPVLRQAINGRISIPPGGVLHAVYENGIYREQQRRAGKLAAPGAQNAPAMQPPMQPGAASGEQPLALARKMDILDDNSQSSGETDALLALPPQQRLAKLASMQPAEFESFMQSLRPPQRQQLTAGMAPSTREAIEDLENPQRLIAGEVMAERLTRDIYADAQLQEVMTDFWLNHFNIYLRKNELMPYYLVSYARDTIRPRALGKFEDLLEAVAHSPAMLVYLDNAESTGPHSLAAERAERASFRRPAEKRNAPQGLNENYARELMELHTLGVNGGYTQADVIQVARVLTGWTIDRPLMGGGFVFNPNRHDPGTKKVMGQKIKGSGEQEGRFLLHMLATRPATAQFLCRQLAIRFVSDNPPQALVDRMARSYLASGGDIPTVLRALFHSPEFWAASDSQAKVKTPLEFVVSAARASNADVQNFQPLIAALNQMGMPLYGCIPPSGYDWNAETWVSTTSLVDRMNFALTLASNRFPGIRVNWAPQGQAAPADLAPGAVEEEARLENMLLPGGVSASTRSAALEQFHAQSAQAAEGNGIRPRTDAAPRAMRASEGINRPYNPQAATTPLQREDQLLAGLLLGSPEFQRR
jgi:uncharacterized protein (DUF1800 family)